MSENRIYRHTYDLTAGECNAEGIMPLTLLTERLIETATEHANSLDIGYARLIQLNLAWVLSRVAIEIDRMPGINDVYTVETWIESTNRLFSERCFRLSGADGLTLAYARTTWAAIDVTTRRPANLSVLGDIMFPENYPECPVKPAPHMAPLSDAAETSSYTFTYTDLDFNRHVNTVRYVGLILNHWPLDWHDTHRPARFDIVFHHECHYGDSAELHVDNCDNRSLCEIICGDNRAVTAAITWRDREKQI